MQNAAIFIAFLVFLLTVVPALADVEVGSDAFGHRVAEKLRALGFVVRETDMKERSSKYFQVQNGFDSLLNLFGLDESQDAREMFLALMDAGWGIYDNKTSEWTPTSRQVYAFDAEVFDIAHMYTLFLQGVESIVPELTITEIEEDLSGMRVDSDTGIVAADGKRKVSFRCNGHAYETELESMHDWFNSQFIEYMNGVLEKEGYPGKLWVVSSEYEQTIIMIYGTEQRATLIREAIRL